MRSLHPEGSSKTRSSTIRITTLRAGADQLVKEVLFPGQNRRMHSNSSSGLDAFFPFTRVRHDLRGRPLLPLERTNP